MGEKCDQDTKLQNVFIYIGNNKDFRKNALCTGGPILDYK